MPAPDFAAAQSGLQFAHMLIDFQQHYTPPELLKGNADAVSVQVDQDGNPNYLLNPLLADLTAHIRVMDAAGIDAGVLTCGSGFDQPDVATCRLINDRMRQAEQDHPGRFIGLAHVPALKPAEAVAELKRCAVELGFPGVVVASELQDQPLDAEELKPFWKACADLGLYVFIHPLPRVIRWGHMGADDLGRMLGWEFSLMTATVRIINSGLLDELPALKIQFSHFSGGIGRYLGRIRGFQQRDKWGTAKIARHGRRPPQPFDHYLDHRLYYDIAGPRGRGLYRGGARAFRQRPGSGRRRQCRKAHPRSGATACQTRAERRQGARMNDRVDDAKTFDPAAHGWEIVNNTPFGDLVGPIWKHETPERLRWGFVVEPKHLNRAGNLHGGMLMTFADQSMAMTARQATNVKRHATIELNTQFIGSVQLGQFVEAHAEVVRATRSVVFMEVKMFVEGRIVVSANGIWKILEE